MSDYAAQLVVVRCSLNPGGWLLIDRELSIPTSEGGGGGLFSIDHVFVDGNGIPIFVEVKRSSDHRLRREVIGQILDYASHACIYWPDGQLRNAFQQRCHEAAVDPLDEINATFDFDDEDVDVDEFWARVNTNLRAGRIRLMVVADEIPSEVKRVVEFLNGQLRDAEMLAVELRQFVGEEVRTIVPTVHGLTGRGAARAHGPRRRWTKEGFLDEVRQRHDAATIASVSRLLDWVDGFSSRMYWGTGTDQGSFIPIIGQDGIDYRLFACFTGGPSIQILFDVYADTGLLNGEEREALRQRLNSIRGVNIPADHINRRTSFPLGALNDPAHWQEFKGIMQELIDKIRKADV